MQTDFQLTILGSDGSWPGPGGACSGYLLQSTSTSLWIDAGSGTLARLQQHLSPRDLDAVIVTHEHADHCTDINGLYVYGAHGPGFSSPLAVYAADGVAESALPGAKLDGVFHWRIIEDDMQVVIGDITLRFLRTDHGPPTFAVLAECNGKTFAYSADTGPRWSLSSFDMRIDLALCEAAFLPGVEGEYHLNPEQAAADALVSSVAKLVLTHVRPGVDKEVVSQAAASVFGSPVRVAQTGDVFVID